MARNAAERLVQAEALYAMLNPAGYDDKAFYAAWRNVILYNEHTWGAHCSISQPDAPFTLSQWKIKQAFAVDAASQAEDLTAAAMKGHRSTSKKATAVDVFNTTSWPRTDLVTLPTRDFGSGDRVHDAARRVVLSQEDHHGDLQFVARDVPPLGVKRFYIDKGPTTARASAIVLIEKGQPAAEVPAIVYGNVLTNGSIRVEVDERTGSIASLKVPGVPVDLVDRAAGMGLNDYRYVAGRDPRDAESADSMSIVCYQCGPLVATLGVLSESPGCESLLRVLQVVDGIDRMDVRDVLHKKAVLAKESVHLGFAMNVPNGTMRIDVPWALVRPETDQLPGSCKNYFTVGRWVDVSNDDYGVTWATLDAPLVEVGGITVDVPNPLGAEGWIKHLEPSTTFYSYVMNNYWETNYKASQEGSVVFRYSIRPHGKFDAAAAKRFGIERSQPLIVVPVDKETPLRESLLRVDPVDVIVSSIKPSRDGKALIVRLFNAGDRAAKATLAWGKPAPARVSLSSPFEENGEELQGPVELPACGIVTLRADR